MLYLKLMLYAPLLVDVDAAQGSLAYMSPFEQGTPRGIIPVIVAFQAHALCTPLLVDVDAAQGNLAYCHLVNRFPKNPPALCTPCWWM